MGIERSFPRRTFLTFATASAAAALVAACGGNDYPTLAPRTPTAGAGAAGGVATAAPCCTPTAAPAQGAPGQSQGTGDLPTPRNQTVVGERVKYTIFDSFNPYIPNGEHADCGLHQGCRESLFYANFQTGEIIPWLATKHEYNADFTQLTLSLNPNARWSDGKPYTSGDVVFTIDLLAKNRQLNGSSAVTSYVDGASAPGPNTVVLRLKQPNPRFHYNFTAGIFGDTIKVVPKHIWEKEDAGTFKNNPPIFTGPYVLDRVVAQQFMFVWKRNPDYWNKANLDPKPRYMVWRQAGTADAMVQEFTRGNVDLPTYNTFDYPLQESIKNSYKNMVRLNFLDPCPRGMWFNQDSPSGLFQTAEGRHAVSYLLDRETIGKTIWQPPSTPAKYPWADWTVNQKWQNPEIQKKYDLTFDPRRAEQLLDGLGATRSGGVRQLNGKPLSLTCITHVAVGQPEYQIGQSLAENAKKVGIEMQVRSLVGTPFSDAFNNGDYDLTSHNFCGTAFDPNQLYTQFDERFYQPIGTRTTQGNATRTRIAELSAIAAKLDGVDPADRANKPLFDQGLEVFMKHLPAMPSIQTIYPLVYNTTYWTGWPTQDKLYNVPAHWWAQFLFVLGRLEPTGR